MGYPNYPQQPYGYGQPPTQPMPDYLQALRMQQQYAQGMQQYTPMAQPQPAPQQTATGAPVWVQGEAGAKAFMVVPGASAFLLDSEQSCFYLKTCDAAGMPSMRTFDYTERGAQQTPQATTPEYVTRAEYEQLCARLDELTAKRKAKSTEKEDAGDEKSTV